MVAAVMACDGVALEVSLQVPGVSHAALRCLFDQLSESSFFGSDTVPLPPAQDEASTEETFAAAKSACLDAAEQEAYDVWSTQQLAAPGPVVPTPVLLTPVECLSIDPAPFAEVLGFDIDRFEASPIIANADQPVGCAYGNPDNQGEWVMLHVATQGFQRGLYEAHEPSIPEVAEVWPDLTGILDYAGVHYIASGGKVELHEGAVTATFADGNGSAAVIAGDYVLMVSAGAGGDGPPLTRANLAGAAEALATALALS